MFGLSGWNDQGTMVGQEFSRAASSKAVPDELVGLDLVEVCLCSGVECEPRNQSVFCWADNLSFNYQTVRKYWQIFRPLLAIDD